MSGQLVEQWPLKPLGEICDILDRLRKPITKRNRVSGEYPYYGATGIVDYVDDYIFDEKLILIGEDGAKWESGENTAFSVEGKCWVNNHAHVIRPNRNIVLDNWLIYFLNMSDLTEHITGLTVPKLNQGKLREIQIPIPPLDEQKRIVRIIDEAFESITESVEQLKLNLINANGQFSSILQSILTVEDDEWNESPLIQVVEETCTLSYGIVQPGVETVGGIPVVRPTDLSQDLISTNGLKRIEPSRADSYSRTELVGGEILLCVRGSTGKISIASEELKGANVTRGIVPIRFDLTKISQKFGYYLLLSEYLQLQIREKTYGSTLQQINIRDVKQLVVRFPPLERQATILLKLESLFTQTKNLSLNYESKYENIIALKQSILQEAFSGTLRIT